MNKTLQSLRSPTELQVRVNVKYFLSGSMVVIGRQLNSAPQSPTKPYEWNFRYEYFKQFPSFLYSRFYSRLAVNKTLPYRALQSPGASGTSKRQAFSMFFMVATDRKQSSAPQSPTELYEASGTSKC